MTKRPVILLVTDANRGVLEAEFRARYDRDYTLDIVHSAADAYARAQELCHGPNPLAMIACEYALPDALVVEILRTMQSITPTSRRLALLDRGHFAQHLEQMRQATLERDMDAFLMIPQGLRDEEFHTAVVELLSEWGWTVAQPLVSAVDIVSDGSTAQVAAIRDLLERMGIPNRVLDPEDEDAQAVLEQAGADVELPVVRVFNGRVLSGATAPAVNEAISTGFDSIPEDSIADVVVVGAGPAGLAAAVYAASEGLDTIVLEADAIGGQAGSSSMIRNYLGFPRGISGMRLAQRSRTQASRFGAKFYAGRPATSITAAPADEPEHLHVNVDGTSLCARSVVVATGVAYRRLESQAINDLIGMGVHYGAATSVAREMQDREVFVVGGGNSAGQAAVHMAKFARTVTIVVRRESIAETMSDYLVREVAATPNIHVKTRTRVIDGGGSGRLEWIRLEEIDAPGPEGSGASDTVPADGLFCLLGARPDCGWLPEDLARDENSFILTGRDVPPETWIDGLPPASLETTVPGIFAVGDVRSGSMKRVASAAGEGASVLPLVHAHLAKLRRRAHDTGEH